MMEDACAFPNRVKVSRTRVLPCAAGDVIWSSANEEESGSMTVTEAFPTWEPSSCLGFTSESSRAVHLYIKSTVAGRQLHATESRYLLVDCFLNNGHNDQNIAQVSRSEGLTFIDISATKIAVKM